jgi:hypothetical protein
MTYIVTVLRELVLYEEKYNVITELWHYQGDGKWKVYRPDLYLKNIAQPVWWHEELYDDEGLLKAKTQPKRIRPPVAAQLRKRPAGKVK